MHSISAFRNTVLGKPMWTSSRIRHFSSVMTKKSVLGNRNGGLHNFQLKMSLNCGIVGLPNVGKSTLFNALVGSEAAQAANFPFCTIGK